MATIYQYFYIKLVLIFLDLFKVKKNENMHKIAPLKRNSRVSMYPNPPSKRVATPRGARPLTACKNPGPQKLGLPLENTAHAPTLNNITIIYLSAGILALVMFVSSIVVIV